MCLFHVVQPTTKGVSASAASNLYKRQVMIRSSRGRLLASYVKARIQSTELPEELSQALHELRTLYPDNEGRARQVLGQALW